MIRYIDKRVFVLFISILSLIVDSSAQEVTILANQQKLSTILIGLNKDYDVSLSFNQKILDKCIVSDSATYKNPEAAIQSLTVKCGFHYELSNGVFIIYSSTSTASTSNEQKSFHFSGQLLDSYSRETLSFSKILIGSVEYVCDKNANFSFLSDRDKITIIVSHPGYYIQSFELENGVFNKLELTPSVIGLKEIVLTGEMFSEVANNRIGDLPGLIKLNQKAAKFLPGNNNNTLYNFIRLQPGVLASAEQSREYVIWGSYRGQTLLRFDGITLFSATSINNEIGLINPLIVKDIEIFKGGYSVDKGDRVGGIVNITGNSGSTERVKGNVNVNNKTISAILSVPIAEKYSIQAAFRQSYYGLIDWDEVFSSSIEEESYSPDYSFSDLNLKFSGNFESGDNFYISTLANKDNSLIEYESTGSQTGRLLSSDRYVDQKGASFHYNKNWKKYGRTEFDVAYSNYNRIREEEYKERQSGGGQNTISLQNENYIDESSLKIEHKLPGFANQQINFGLTYFSNVSSIYEGELEADQELYYASNSRLNFFIKDDINFGRYFSLIPGVRMDYFTSNQEFYLQPRIQAIIRPADRWRVNLGWGFYNQYVSSILLTDDLNNKYNNWVLTDDTDYPVINGVHYVFGLSYKNVGLSVSAEAYYKTTDNLTRYRVIRNKGEYQLLYGDSKSYGIDLYVEKRINKHNFWVSYSLGKTEERFGAQVEYKRAYQDQTHEIKGAGILDFQPWYISANYVYGSGLYGNLNQTDLEIVPYSRMDLALLYKFNTQSVNIETGLSIENLFNTRNVAYGSISKLPGGQAIYSRAIPFTPSVFVNIGF